MPASKKPRSSRKQTSGTDATAPPNLLVGERLPSEPKQRRSVEKRARLKSAGLALFAEEGYERTSINDIARRADFPVGTFYQHFRSKRQLLLVLMSDLLQKLSQLNLRPAGGTNLRESLRAMLSRTFSHDLHYLGVYRAWQEVALSDADLTRKQKAIHDWTTARVRQLFRALQQSPNARENVSIPGLARAMDHFFWGLLAQAIHLPKAELRQSIDAATHLIYHALFRDDG